MRGENYEGGRERGQWTSFVVEFCGEGKPFSCVCVLRLLLPPTRTDGLPNQ